MALATSLCAFSMAGAEAKNVVLDPDADFSSAPFTISFGGGAATYTFTYVNDGLTADAVSTGGSALVNSFLGVPIPFELGTPIGGNGYDSFTAFPSPAGILYSIAEDSIGLQFQLPDGVHFGYVTTIGPRLFNTVITTRLAPDRDGSGRSGTGDLGDVHRRSRCPGSLGSSERQTELRVNGSPLLGDTPGLK